MGYLLRLVMQIVQFVCVPSDRDIFTQQREKRAQADFEAGGPRIMGFHLYCAVSEIEHSRSASSNVELFLYEETFLTQIGISIKTTKRNNRTYQLFWCFFLGFHQQAQ